MEIETRTKYLRELNQQIAFAEQAGSEQIQSIRDEIEQLDYKKASLMQENFSLEQKIRENQEILLILDKQVT